MQGRPSGPHHKSATFRITGYPTSIPAPGLAIVSSAFIRVLHMKKIWLTTDGRPHDSVLGIFTTEAAATRYRDLLVERYSLGKNLSLSGKPLAGDADAWRLGLGPDVVERTLDDNLDYLRGAWVVK